MKRILLLLAVYLWTMPAFSQQDVPEELKGDWLLPSNNAWKFGFYDHFAMVDGSLWDYTAVHTKRNQVILQLQKDSQPLKLTIRTQEDGKIIVTNASGAQMAVTRKPIENPDYARYENEGFDEPLVQAADFQLSGFIQDFDPKKENYKYANVIYTPLLQRDQVIHLVPLDSLGRFSITFPLLNPQEIMFKFGNSLVGLFAVPGSKVTMNVNKSGGLLFAGPEGLLNTELNGFMPRFHGSLPYTLHSEQIEKLGQTEYCAYRLGKMDDQLADLEQYSKQHRTSKRFRQQMDARIRYSAADDLMRYRWLREISLSADYMKFLDLVPINNPLGVLTANYSAFLREYLSYARSVSGNTMTIHSLPELLARAQADGATLDPGDEAKLVSLETFYKTDSVAAAELIEKYRDLFEDASASLSMDALEEQLLQAVSGLRAGTGQDVLFGIIATDLMDRVRKPLKDEKLAFYRDHISIPAIYSEIERINSELTQKIAEPLSSKMAVIPALKAAQDEVFEALTEPYQGNVIYIDFWAPWCGPCMANMPAAKSLKEEMAGKNVVFLYLGVNCSEESWKNTIKSEEIEGEHYLLSKDEYALLSSRFNIGGIPRYMLVDKEGNLIDDEAEGPYSGQIRRRIQTLLK